MNKYFNNCTCIEDVKAEYKRLALENHPDLGGSTEAMQAINNAYEKAFERFKNIHKAATGETYTAQTETNETAAEFMQIINQLINCEGLKIELIGRWIWVSGNTKEHKETLRKLNFKWCNNKKMWSWHKAEDKKLSRKTFDIDNIRGMFGSTEFETKSKKALPA